MKNYHLLFSALFLLSSCTSEVKVEQAEVADSSTFEYHATSHEPSHPTDSAANPFNGKELTAEAYENGNLGWGYSISIDGKKTINQANVPGIQGKKGFKTKEQALKTADFVMYKIRHNSFPPSVTAKELDSLDVLK
ncbi:MAG: DUF4907 domain-containing protein [Cytophagaceae bacterium]|nr:DUF4907 domain-containing protein [Cytophagaceae bacterium]